MSLEKKQIIIAEYIWLDNESELRSKTRVLYNTHIDFNNVSSFNVSTLPIWNYDGSSTYQATTENSEIILKPCAMFDYFENWNSVKQMPVPPKKKEIALFHLNFKM